MPRWYDVPGIWREWANDVRGGGINCGHYLAEEAPEATAEALIGVSDGYGLMGNPLAISIYRIGSLIDHRYGKGASKGPDHGCSERYGEQPGRGRG